MPENFLRPFRGVRGRFDLLIIESTGISEPLPVAATFLFVDEFEVATGPRQGWLGMPYDFGSMADTVRPMDRTGEFHPALEEYCECIFELGEDNLDVIQARIAERLEVSRPAVSEMIKKLATEKLVVTADGQIRLTRCRTSPRRERRPPPSSGRTLPH